MSSESDMYRLKLEEVLKHFGNKRVLTVVDVSGYLGTSRPWCYRNLKHIGKKIYTVEDLAKDLCV